MNTTFVLKLTPNAEGKRNGKGRKIFYFDITISNMTFISIINLAKRQLETQAGKYFGVDWRRYYRTALEVRNG